LPSNVARGRELAPLYLEEDRMPRSVRSHLSYANVVATFALVFAMGGTAIAAKRYLITSTGQISPKVLKKLTGKTGPRGASGPKGAKGVVGASGPAGAAGAAGAAGGTGATGATGPAGGEGKEGKAGTEGKQGDEGREGREGREGKEGAGLTEPERETLKMLLEHLSYSEAGVDGKPTVRFSGVNVQVLAGAKENETTGLGNLIVGNDEGTKLQTGSNNLVVGGEQEFTSFGASLGGFDNKALAEYTGAWGHDNTANGAGASVSGGEKNDAEAEWAAVLGGFENIAKGKFSTVIGSEKEEAEHQGEVVP
jgi:hypothetical protein